MILILILILGLQRILIVLKKCGTPPNLVGTFNI